MPAIVEVPSKQTVPNNVTFIDIDDSSDIVLLNPKKDKDKGSKMVPEEIEDRMHKRKQMMAKMQEKMLKQKLIPEREVSAPKQVPSAPQKIHPSKQTSFELLPNKTKETESKKSVSQTKSSQPKAMLQDVRVLPVQELKLDEFRKYHLKGKSSKYRQYVQVEELRRLFK